MATNGGIQKILERYGGGRKRTIPAMVFWFLVLLDTVPGLWVTLGEVERE
ncbi:MAG: hypothetical protein GXO78_13765 [Calditrichaeota bacterium]|nr:hypothetical protein [Calditrichota bacterium]